MSHWDDLTKTFDDFQKNDFDAHATRFSATVKSNHDHDGVKKTLEITSKFNDGKTPETAVTLSKKGASWKSKIKADKGTLKYEKEMDHKKWNTED